MCVPFLFRMVAKSRSTDNPTRVTSFPNYLNVTLRVPACAFLGMYRRASKKNYMCALARLVVSCMTRMMLIVDMRSIL